MKHYLALCLAVLLILVPTLYLFGLVSTIDLKLDNLQQSQLSDSEKTTSDLERLREELIHMIAEINTENGDEYLIMAALIDCQCASNEEHESTQPSTIPTEPSQVPTRPTTQPTQPPTLPTLLTQPTEPTRPPTQPTQPPSNYYGRLCIPDVGIDVGLYYGAQQEICDRQDSASVFSMSVFDGLYIADHNTQEFGKLADVTVGTQGYIHLSNGTTFDIVCTDVLSGCNTGDYIVDEDGNTDFNADYLMYTCKDNRISILICLWKHDVGS